MAQPASPIGRVAERIGGTNKVVSSTSISEVLYCTNIGCVIERVAVAPMDVPPVLGMTAVTVSIASDWQRKQTKKHKRGQTFHGNQIFCTQRTIVTRSRISPGGFISPATSARPKR
jgi:hypothetical protein